MIAQTALGFTQQNSQQSARKSAQYIREIDATEFEDTESNLKESTSRECGEVRIVVGKSASGRMTVLLNTMSGLMLSVSDIPS